MIETRITFPAADGEAKIGSELPQRIGRVFGYMLVIGAGLMLGALLGMIVGLVTGLVPFDC